ncbi:MAG TPA: hypothetical protein VFF42_02270, partial [Candidatus Eremiobacteraceae bacterium]|nr:hypothetical protein [Candidatus Eremiobacteraceae bacterium]
MNRESSIIPKIPVQSYQDEPSIPAKAKLETVILSFVFEFKHGGQLEVVPEWSTHPCKSKSREKHRISGR